MTVLQRKLRNKKPITVEESYHDAKHTNEKRFHNLKYIEKVADVPVGAYATNSRKSRSAMGSLTTEYSISDLYSLVKKYDKDFTPGKSVNPALLNENGNLLVMYHGSPNAVFTVFKQWQYFTDKKWFFK